MINITRRSRSRKNFTTDDTEDESEDDVRQIIDLPDDEPEQDGHDRGVSAAGDSDDDVCGFVSEPLQHDVADADVRAGQVDGGGDKAAARRELSRLTAEYLNADGAITHCCPGKPPPKGKLFHWPKRQRNAALVGGDR
jgi:hypothetical protein